MLDGNVSERATVDERYAGAVSTSSLLAPEDYRPTDAYVLVASGMSRKGVGGWLMRLQTEWGRTARPQHAKLPTVGQIAAKLAPVKIGEEGGRTIRGPDMAKAKRLHDEMTAASAQWYDAEIVMMKNRMRDAPQVRDHLCIWLYGEAFAELRDEIRAFPSRRQKYPQVIAAETIVAATILWWLDDTCHSCGGTKWQLVPNTNRQSNRACEGCKATGKQPEPKGDSQRVLDYMRQCVYDWRASTSAQLSTMRDRNLLAAMRRGSGRA